MNKQEKLEIRTELAQRIADFLEWIDEHYPQHDATPERVEFDMADASLAVLNAGWMAFAEGETSGA